MATIVADEFGQEWLVESDDPSDPALAQLKSLGFRKFALPRQTIVTGELVELSIDMAIQLGDAWEACKLEELRTMFLYYCDAYHNSLALAYANVVE